jgi:hypothetical protein
LVDRDEHGDVGEALQFGDHVPHTRNVDGWPRISRRLNIPREKYHSSRV